MVSCDLAGTNYRASTLTFVGPQRLGKLGGMRKQDRLASHLHDHLLPVLDLLTWAPGLEASRTSGISASQVGFISWLRSAQLPTDLMG
ncbi:MAG: hypothetical protein DMG87_10780 [Acidobacteria bacterium]|nr:MAG: hypothetical protein DMG87_10780 [Acidobacteriota bacterium]